MAKAHLHPRRSPSERFWPKADVGHSDDCWEWQAARDELGYGFFRMTSGENMWKAHRAAWVLIHGLIPPGLIVCHHCDNPPCVNPSHLFLGTPQDNVDDRVRKGRSSRLISHFGETSPKAKLTAAQVAEIRERYSAGGVYQRELGEEFGVDQTQIGRIVRGVRWKQSPATTQEETA
jgi:hypothetical protein